MDDLDLEWCLVRSAEGDQLAWGRLVTRFTPLLWAVARAHRLSDADASDAVQGTWLRLVENLGRIREPERVGAWLATTCRRETTPACRLINRASSSTPRACGSGSPERWRRRAPVHEPAPGPPVGG